MWDLSDVVRVPKRATDDVQRLCQAGLDTISLRRALARVLWRSVPFDASTWETVDPATLLVTSAVDVALPAGLSPRLCENEYLHEDFNKISGLSRSGASVGVLSEATAGQPQRSRRYREIMAPHQWAHELRAVFTVDGACWGALTLFRGIGRPDFTPQEAAWVRRLAPAIASGLRVGLLAAACDSRSGAETASDGPALVVLDARDELRTMTVAAGELLADLADVRSESPPMANSRSARPGAHSRPGSNPGASAGLSDGRAGPLPAPVYAVAAAVRAVEASGSQASPARLRVQSRSGRWLVLYGSRLASARADPGDVAVFIEPARAPQMAPLIAAAYDLTSREQDVLRLVLGGASSSEIARTLYVSAYTVQDHLKAVFSKVGVHSRRGLVARFMAEQYIPLRQRQEAPGPWGWFANPAPVPAFGS
jgi:DNA-binding CsgD family transcriptional regulator